jgi:hypothetical protein
MLLQCIKQRKPDKGQRKLHIPVSKTNSALPGAEKVG